MFELDGWCLMESYEAVGATSPPWTERYIMRHRCGIERDHYVRKAANGWLCVRCTEHAPDGMIGVYEMMNWETSGYGG